MFPPGLHPGKPRTKEESPLVYPIRAGNLLGRMGEFPESLDVPIRPHRFQAGMEGLTG